MHALIIAREDAYIMRTGVAARVGAVAGALNACEGGRLVEVGVLVLDGIGRDIARFRDMPLWGGEDETPLLSPLRWTSDARRRNQLAMRENEHHLQNERRSLQLKREAKRWVAIHRVEDVCICTCAFLLPFHSFTTSFEFSLRTPVVHHH